MAKGNIYPAPTAHIWGGFYSPLENRNSVCTSCCFFLCATAMTVETETTTMDMTAGQGMDPADPEEGTGVDGQTGQSGWTKYRDGWSDRSVWVEVV